MLQMRKQTMEHLCLLDTGNFISGPSVRSDPLSPLCILRLLLPSSLLSPPPSLPHCRAMAFLVGAREADLRPRPYLNHNSLYHQTSRTCAGEIVSFNINFFQGSCSLFYINDCNSPFKRPFHNHL